MDQIKELQDRIRYLEDLLEQNSIKYDKNTLSQPIVQKDSCIFTISNKNLLSYDQIERYKRQMLLQEISFHGQVKLTKSRVLVIGVGGIGGPAALYLAGSGIGTIGLVDGDKVELSNLHRQIIHTTQRIGQNKCISAYKTLQQYNNLVRVNLHETHLTPDNAKTIVDQYDIVLDATDNPQTRYLINDICVLLKKPLVSGSAVKWEGQISLYNYSDGPCYRCLFPLCPKATQACSEVGVMGVAPGLVGLLEALEAVKIIIGAPNLTSKMILIDCLTGSMKTVKLRGRQKNCAICGENPNISDVKNFNYAEFTGSCEVQQIQQAENYINISWKQLAQNIQLEQNAILIDCRPKKKFKNIPWNEIKYMEDEEINKQIDININQKIFIMCKRGISSKLTCNFLASKGYKNLYSIIGGITQFVEDFDQGLPIP